MADLYLQSLMQGNALKKRIKNRFDDKTEKEIDVFVDSLNFDEGDLADDKFNSPAIKRARLKAELKEEAKLPELSNFINTAFKILATQGANYLKADEFEKMHDDFIKAINAFDEIDLNSPSTENFHTILHLNDSTIDSIMKVASSKFNESEFSDGLALYILLSALVPENPEFWERGGILAHKSENYELALRLYSAALSIDPLLLGPWVFSIDCCLNQSLFPQAEIAYTEAMKICEASNADNSWKEMLAFYCSQILADHA